MLQLTRPDVSHHSHSIVRVTWVLPQDREAAVMSTRANECEKLLSQTLHSVIIFDTDCRGVAGYLKDTNEATETVTILETYYVTNLQLSPSILMLVVEIWKLLEFNDQIVNAFRFERIGNSFCN